MEILIVTPGGGVDFAALGNLPPGAVARATAWATHGSDLPVAEPTGLLGRLRRRVRAVTTRSMPALLLVAATPLDEGRLFWRAARRTVALLDAARRADLVVAVDRDGVLTAWRLGRLTGRTGAATSVLGYPAARAAIARRCAQ